MPLATTPSSPWLMGNRFGGPLAQTNARYFSGFGKPCSETSIGVPTETLEGEKRVALSPEGVKRLVKEGFTVNVERGAGSAAGMRDEDFNSAGANIVDSAYDSDIVFKVRPPSEEEATQLAPDSGLISFLYPTKQEALVAQLEK